jgi:iron complex outermembrane receptor protein
MRLAGRESHSPRPLYDDQHREFPACAAGSVKKELLLGGLMTQHEGKFVRKLTFWIGLNSALLVTPLTAMAQATVTQAAATPATAGQSASNPAANVQTGPAEQDIPGIQEVVVRARRVEELSQDVPIVITTISAETLRDRNISDPNDLIAIAPSLVIGQNGEGIRDAPSFTLRGQSTTFEGSPGVVIYLNEVPLATPVTLSNQGAPGNFLDLSSIEVLSGPQGTLFGRNTTGGAVLLSPNKPMDNFQGYLEAGYGNYDDREIEGVFNVPLIKDVLKARLAFETKDRNGYTHDVLWNVDRDDTHWDTARLGIEWTPNDTLDNYTMVYGTDSHNHGPGSINIALNVGTPTTPSSLIGQNAYYWGLTGGLVGCNPKTGASDPPSCVNATAYYQGLASQAASLGPRSNALSLNEFDYQRTWGATNTTRVALNDTTALRNIFSYAKFKDGYSLDGDGTPAYQYDTGVNGYSSEHPRDNFHNYTEELQLQGSLLDSALSYTVGAFYFTQGTDGPQSAQAVEYCFYSLTIANQCGTGFVQSNTFSESTRSSAVYAQASYSLGHSIAALQGLTLTLGFRETWDSVSGSSQYSDGFTSTSFADSVSTSAPSWTAGLDYKVTDKVLTYAKVSHGYKAGGYNTFAVYPDTQIFGPEYDTTVELGVKSQGRVGHIPVLFNLSGYRTDYSNIQRAAIDYNPSDFDEGAQVINSASAIIQGIEVQLDARLTRDLEFGLNYSYTDAYYTKFPYTPHEPFLDAAGYVDCHGKPWTVGATLDLSCRPLQYISPHILGTHLKYTLPLAASVGNISALVNFSYQDAQHTEALFGSQQPHELLPPFALLGASIAWQNIYSSGFDVNLYVTNATDKLYRTSNTDVYQSLGVDSTLYGEPRMYGIKVRYHWGT